MKERLSWLDLLKGIAILAVIIDHTYGVFYKNILIQYHTGFSVALFIFLAGITSAMSLSHGNFMNFYKKRLVSIIIPFIIATALFSLLNDKSFINSLLHFNATGPMYFIAFFMELILIAPLLNKLPYYFLILIIPLSIYLNKFSFIPFLWGGGNKLFGGTFLLMFYLGFLFYKNIEKFNNIRFKLINIIIPILLLIFFEYFKLYPKIWHNPPYTLTFIYTFSIFWLVFNLRLNYQNKILKFISYCGRNSLYIFLYHPIIFSLIRLIK
jgi:fucose 4-O-acetylase-like acetyltransferase